VLKLLKNLIKNGESNIHLTLVTESPISYYSGMLPGTVSKLYEEDDIKIHLEPLAKWCKAEYVEQRVTKIIGNENKLELENGETLAYDILAVNVGSKTKDTGGVKGAWEHSLTTRPINELLPKIRAKEE
jgi:selenide,water dikinase